ncbi:MAG: RHS repeat protein [Planctomycetes bacterium]|nr:RHS repeat protein [Planctomycetota bacterium]
MRSNLGTVDAGSTETVTVVTTATQAGDYTNRAEVEGGLWDPDPGNNYSIFSFEVTELPSTVNKANGNLIFSGDDGDPVNTFTGGLFSSYPADLNLRGPMPLFFSRNYDSFIKSDGNITSSLGDNWLGNFDMTLTQNGSAVEVITNRGRLIQFEQNGVSWNLTGKTDIAYQLVQSGTDFILGDPYTGRMYTFARDLPNSGTDPLIIDNFLNPMPRIEALNQDGTFPVRTGTTVEGSMLGGELDALLVLDGVQNPADGAYFTVEQGRAIFSQDATSTGRVLLIWDGVDGDAVRVVASTGLGGGVDLTQDGTVDGIEIEVARNDLPLKVALIVYTGVEKTSELTLDIPVTDSPVTFRYPFSDLTSLGESADLTRVTTVIVLVGAQGSANGPVHIEIDSIKMTSSAINATPSDTIRKLTKIEDGNGNVHTLTYSEDTLRSVSDGLGRTLNFTYTGDQLSSVDDGTRTITFNHTGNDLTGYTDSMGNVTTYTYAAGGLMTAAIRPTGNTPYSQTYDGNERVATQTDANGNTFTFAYAPPDTTLTGPLGNTRVHTHTATGEFSKRTDQAGLSFTMGSDAIGRRNSLTDRLGDTTTLDYDAPSGNLAAVTNADGTTTTYDYTARTHSSGIVFYDLTGITYPDGTTESFVYDSSGNMVSRTGRAGNVWSFTYNGNGQMLTATNPAGGVTTNTYNTDGTLASRTDPAGNKTTFGYDGLKRPNLITVADGTTLSFTYNDHDQLLTSTDGNGNTTTLTYNANGNLTSTTDPLGQTTTFDYDGNDRLLSVTNPLGNTGQHHLQSTGQDKYTHGQERQCHHHGIQYTGSFDLYYRCLRSSVVNNL